MTTPNFQVGSVLNDGTIILAVEFDELLITWGKGCSPIKASHFRDATVERVMDERELTMLNLRLRRWSAFRGMVFDDHGSEVVVLSNVNDVVTIYDRTDGECYELTDVLEAGLQYIRTLPRKEVDDLQQQLDSKA